MYGRVLLPTDGSDPAVVVADHALELASTYGATLHAVYVLKTNEPMPDVEDTEATSEPAPEGQAALENVADRAVDQGITVVQSILRGPVAEAILSYANDHDIDLVVMGTHGRTGLDRLLTGSVAEEVTRNATVPVMTYHAPDD